MEKLEKKFIVACVVAVMGWASNCTARQSAEFHETRARAFETNLRSQETIHQIVERRARQCSQYLDQANAETARCRADLRACSGSEGDLRRQLNACNQNIANIPTTP